MAKNKVEVVIGGTIYALQGEESQEHIQRVAHIINKKTLEVQKKYGHRYNNPTKVNMLVTLNVADEYVKMQDELTAYRSELEKCNAENIALQDKLKELTLELIRVKEELTSLQDKK